MNRKLQQVVAAARKQDPDKFNRLPECIEEFLDYGPAISCAFNRPGTLLATGTDNGYIGVWDFETRGLAKTLPADGEPEPSEISSVCWSSNGRYLLSGHAKPSKDKPDRADKAKADKAQNRIILWDVQAGTELREVPMSSGVTQVCLSARKPFLAVVSLKAGPPVVVELSKEQPTVTPLDGINLKAVLDGSGATKQRGHSEAVAPLALLSTSGREVYVAQQQSGKGFLLVYDLASKKLLDVIKLPSPVSSMALSPMALDKEQDKKQKQQDKQQKPIGKDSRYLLLNCIDKVIRLADVAERPKQLKPIGKDAAEAAVRAAAADKQGSLLHPEGRDLVTVLPVTYSIPVDREFWRGAVFTHDGKHVLGASASSKHRVHIWSNSGEPVATLEGPKNDEIRAIAWHPNRMMMVTVSSTGKVYIWAQIYNEEWSAFAPDFQELEENTEYEEREDEFDNNPKKTDKAKPRQNDGDPYTEGVIDERVPVRPFQHLLLDSDDRDGSEEPLLWLVGEVEGPGPDAAPDVIDQQAGGSGSEADASDDEGGPGVSGRTGGAGGDSDADQPRKRKSVRFEDYDHDDQAFEDLMKMQEDYAKQRLTMPKPPGGRRGRPPGRPRASAGRGGEASDRGHPQPVARGPGGAAMRGTYVFGSSGTLSPADSDPYSG